MTTREKAMQWWDGLGDNYYQRIILKQELTDKYLPKRNFGTLTDKEIEEIWRKENDKLSIEETHRKIRGILIDYGNEEYGDCIIDEICQLFNFPTTIDIEPEEE